MSDCPQLIVLVEATRAALRLPIVLGLSKSGGRLYIHATHWTLHNNSIGSLLINTARSRLEGRLETLSSVLVACSQPTIAREGSSSEVHTLEVVKSGHYCSVRSNTPAPEPDSGDDDPIPQAVYSFVARSLSRLFMISVDYAPGNKSGM